MDHPQLVELRQETPFRQHVIKASSDDSTLPSVDVSDLGLTMDDLNEPLPPELLMGITSTGYESTSRIASVQDDGCEWAEAQDSLLIQLKIPGLRGQPAAAMAVTFSTTTISVSVFGRIVWSVVLRGTIVPDKCKFETEDGQDMVPIIRLSVEKEDKQTRWGGFIEQIGEDSII